jgi:uncharacterized protein YkwD
VKNGLRITAATAATTLVAALGLGLPLTASVSAHSHSHACNGAAAAPKTISARAAQRAVKCLLNKQRTKRGLHSLHSSRDLKRAAHRHSAYMQRHGCFDHQCPGEGSIDARLRRTGYLTSGLHRWIYGENIAYGTEAYASPRAMVKAWMASSEHRANILNPSFRDIGVGVVWGLPGKRHGHGGIYTTDFGLRR